MKKIITLSAFLLGLALMLQPFITFTNVAQPLAGYTGSPVDGKTCAFSGCHTGGTANGNQILLSTVGGNSLTNGYAASTTYNMTINLNNFNAPRSGFSLSVLDDNNNQAGSFNLTNPTSTSVATLAGRDYVGHKSVAAGTVSWTFQWISPATSTGQVKFYIAANKGTNNTVSTDDAIGTAVYAVSPSTGLTLVNASGGTGIEVLSADENGIDIFPNPISNRVSFSYSVDGNKNVSAALYNLNGQMVQEFFNEEKTAGEHNESFNINSEMSMGLYLIQVKMDDKVFFKKVMAN